MKFSRPIRLRLSSCVSFAVVPSSSRFSYVILIRHRLHHQASLFLSPLSRLYATYLLLSQSPANHRASRDASIVAPRRLQQSPPPPNLEIAMTPPTPVSNVVPICLINAVSAVILTILPTAAPEQQHSLFQKSSVHIEAKAPFWTVPLSLCSVPSYFLRPRPGCSRIGYLLPGRTQRRRSVPEICPAWGPTVIPTSRPSTAPTRNPPPMLSYGPSKTHNTGTTVARFLVTPPLPIPPLSLSLTSPSLSYCVPPSRYCCAPQTRLSGATFRLSHPGIPLSLRRYL